MGQVQLEYFCVSETLSQHGRPAQLERLVVEPAGTVPLALATASALGMPTRIGSALALDHAGRFLRESLQKAGMELGHIYPASGSLSPLRFNILQGKHRHHYASAGNMMTDDAHFDFRSMLHQVRLLIVSDDCGDLDIVEACEAANAMRIPVVCDIANNLTLLSKIVPLASVLVVGEQIAAEVSHCGSPEQSLAWFEKQNVPATVITMGDSGCVASRNGKIYRESALDVEVKDTSGAGAVFTGALSSAMVSDLGFGDCLRYANTAAAIACTRLGAWAALPTKEEIQEALHRPSERKQTSG